MAETPAQQAARIKREAAAKAARPNTGASQGFFGAIKSLAPGGQKANWGAVGQNAKNIAGELSGAYDLKRGITNISKSGILPGGQKADWGKLATGLGQTVMGVVGAVPVVGTAARGTITALRAANVLSKADKASTFMNAVNKVTTPLYVPKTQATTVMGRGGQAVVKGLTTPYAITQVVGGVTGALAGPGGTPRPTPVGPIAKVQGPGLGGRDQNLGGTVTTTTTGRTTGTGAIPRIAVDGAKPGTTAPTNVVRPTSVTDSASSVTMPTGTVNTNTIEGINKASGFSTSAEQTGALQTGGGAASTGGSAVGIPGAVQSAGSDFLAALAADATRTYGRNAAFRDVFAQGVEGAQGRAADIIGGRSQAILGQGLQGVQRDLAVAKAAEAQRMVAEREASRKAYSDAMGKAYNKQAQDILEAQAAKSEQAARIRGIG